MIQIKCKMTEYTHIALRLVSPGLAILVLSGMLLILKYLNFHRSGPHPLSTRSLAWKTRTKTVETCLSLCPWLCQGVGARTRIRTRTRRAGARIGPRTKRIRGSRWKLTSGWGYVQGLGQEFMIIIIAFN